MPSNFFYHLKRALELLSSVRKSPFATFYHNLVDTFAPGKKKKKENKSIRTRDRSSGKKYEIPHFVDRSLKLLQ